MTKEKEILRKIYEERVRQDLKWGIQHHSNAEWLAILVEEIGEVAKALLENSNIEEEIIQCMAVCVAWLEDKYR